MPPNLKLSQRPVVPPPQHHEPPSPERSQGSMVVDDAGTVTHQQPPPTEASLLLPPPSSSSSPAKQHHYRNTNSNGGGPHRPLVMPRHNTNGSTTTTARTTPSPPSHLLRKRADSSSTNNNNNSNPILLDDNDDADGQFIKVKTPSTFHNDLMEFVPGSIPHSIGVACTIGVVCGISAYVYYSVLEYALQGLWKTLPHYVFDSLLQQQLPAASSSQLLSEVLWIPLVVLGMSVGVGLSVRVLGEPGDLPSTIQNVHEHAYVSMHHVLPMVVASQFSILGGGSLGPEAPLVAVCAALGGFVSQTVFQTTDRNLIRKHTLMGMSGALAAFFGCPLGGSLFALEVNSRFGIEYFEHTVEAVFCGEVCLAVFRALANLPIVPIWNITNIKLPCAEPLHIVYGAMLGLLGAAIAALFTKFHFAILDTFRTVGLLRDEAAISRALCGAMVISVVGMMIPATMFWGEYEFQTIATLAPSSSLTHVWPTHGLLGFDMNSFGTAVLVGVAKLVCISFTVCGGYRGGFIFPLFCSGAAFGRAVFFLCPYIPVQLCVLCLAAALNVAVTRTSLSTTLILAFLAGEPNAISAILAAALTSLFATAYMPFIKTQVARADIESSIFILDYHHQNDDKKYNNTDGMMMEDTTDDTATMEPLTPLFPAGVKKSTATIKLDV